MGRCRVYIHADASTHRASGSFGRGEVPPVPNAFCLTAALYGLLTTMVVPSLSASGSWLLAG